jgi:hypothetical protein
LLVFRSNDDITQLGTLRYAVAHAQGGDTILLTEELRNHPAVLTQGELILSQDVTIQTMTSFVPPVTVSGGGTSRVFEVSNGAHVILSNLTITGGNGVANNPNGSSAFEGHGGGILSFGTLTVSNCILQNNHAIVEGGGIANIAGTLTVSGSILQLNQAGPIFPDAGRGGGIVNTGTGTISDCTLVENHAGDQGGGILNSGTLTVRNSTLLANGAEHQGGGILNDHGVVTLNNSSITSNVSFVQGGGILNDHGVLTLNNSSIRGNQGGFQGGGIYNAFGTLYVQYSSTVCDNLAAFGGDLYNYFGSYMIDSSSIVCLIYG